MAVLLGELSRFGPVFLLKVRVREEVDQNAVKDLVLSEVAASVLNGELRLNVAPGGGRDPRRPDETA